MDRNKIFKLIETIVENPSIVSSQISDSNIGNLVPIEEVYGGYMCDRAIQFTPHEDYGKKGEIVKADLTDDKIRLKELTKLNNQITKYNKWVGKKNVLYKKEIDAKISELKPGKYTEHVTIGRKNHKEYFPLSYFDMWSFMVTRELPNQKDGYSGLIDSFLIINDEELYKLKEDEDFIPRFNRTIYVYLISKKESAQAEDRWDEENIWYTPYRNFGDWFDKQPEYGDAKPYDIGIYKKDVSDDLHYIAQDCSDKHEEDIIKFPTKRDAYEWWCGLHTCKGKEVTIQQLEDAFSRGKRRGKFDTEHNKPLLEKHPE